MKHLKTALAIALASAGLFAAAQTAGTQDTHNSAAAAEPPPISQWEVAYSGVTAPQILVIKDDKTWSAAWRLAGKDAPIHLPADTLGLAIFLGQFPTGGYGAEVFSAGEADGAYVVRYRLITPRGFVTEAITTPVVFAVVPGSHLPLKVTKEDSARPGPAIPAK
jgi:hypothetical protein